MAPGLTTLSSSRQHPCRLIFSIRHLLFIQSLGLLALAFAVVGVLTGVAIFLNRLLEPKEVMYEPVVLSNSGWDEPADESEAD